MVIVRDRRRFGQVLRYRGDLVTLSRIGGIGRKDAAGKTRTLALVLFRKPCVSTTIPVTARGHRHPRRRDLGETPVARVVLPALVSREVRAIQETDVRPCRQRDLDDVSAAETTQVVL